jgi:hypothetical protein
MKAPNVFRRRVARLATTLALGLAASAAAAQAQQNPLRALTDKLNWTSEADDGPDFVRQSRPDPKTMDFAPLTGEEKQRIAVKKPDEVKADMDRLVRTRKKADAMRRGLNAVKVDPVAPNEAAPIKDE